MKRTIDYIKCEHCDDFQQVFEDDDPNETWYCYNCHEQLN
jgi:ribosomal protein S27E